MPKELTPAQLEAFEAWFYCLTPGKEGFWQRYTKRYLRTVGKGTRTPTESAAKRAMLKAIEARQPSECPQITDPYTFMQICDLALDEQKRYFDACDKARKFCASFPKMTTWFNQAYWEQEIPSYTELKEKVTHSSQKPREKPKHIKGSDATRIKNMASIKEALSKAKTISTPGYKQKLSDKL